MKIINVIAFNVLLAFNLQGQSDTLLLNDTTLQAFTRLNLVADSIETNKDERNYYFSVSASKLIPSKENFSDLIFRIKINDKGETLKQFFLNGNKSGSATIFKNKSKHKFLMLDSLNSANNFYLELTLNLENDNLALSTKEAFWGNITLAGDTLANFVIRPYMIPQNNIVLERTSLASSSTNNKESLQFGEPFELFKKYYKLSKIDLKSKSIILEKVLYEEFKFGYKENRFVENFKELLAKKEKNLLNKADKINNTDYYIFYFWGEWCQPCLKNIDNNKSKFSILDLNKTNFINVALATSQESKLRTIDLINKRKINGLHLIENMMLDSELLISKLSVVTYPSYIVIYKTGKIIYRSDENNTISFDEFIAKAKLVR